jgi:hypothetical protein
MMCRYIVDIACSVLFVILDLVRCGAESFSSRSTCLQTLNLH